MTFGELESKLRTVLYLVAKHDGAAEVQPRGQAALLLLGIINQIQSEGE